MMHETSDLSFDEPETLSACDYASAPVCARGCSTPPEIAAFLSDDDAAAPAGVDTLLFAPDGAFATASPFFMASDEGATAGS